MKSNNPIVAQALAFNDKTNAESIVRAYKKDVRDKLAELNREAKYVYSILVSYGKNMRASAKAETSTGVEQKITAVMNDILPDLYKATNIIEGLAHDAASI